MKKWLKSFVHNAIVHPMMVFMPTNLAHRFHDTNANWAFGLNRYDEISLEKGETNFARMAIAKAMGETNG